MNHTTPAILRKLSNVRESGDGKWKACCPAHDDHDPSLSIAVGDDGRTLLKCFVECKPEAIVAAVGMRMSDLMPESDHSSNTPRSKSSKPRNVHSTVERAIEAAAWACKGKYVAEWPYHDAHGKEVFRVVRFQVNATGEKQYSQVVCVSGGYTVGGLGDNRPLYRLCELLSNADAPVVVVEGEKCCDILRAHELIATTSSNGSQSPRKTDWSPLAGRNVVIIPDNNEAGKTYGNTVATIVSQLVPPAKVKIVPLPGLQNEKDDIEQWLSLGHTLDELLALVAAAAEWQPETVNEVVKPKQHGKQDAAIVRSMKHVRLSDVEPEDVTWLWPERFAIGKLSLISGDPGLGKSFLTLDMAARVSRGGYWPDGSVCPKGSVILLSAEDGLADTIRPRLDAAGADCSKIVALTATTVDLGDTEKERTVDLSSDIAAIEELIKQLADCRLIVIDPISCYLGDTKSHDNAEVRSVLHPLSEMAERVGAALICVSHLRKGDAAAIYRTMGSLGFVAAARAAFAVSKDPNDESGRRRLFLPIKNNIGDDRTGLAYQLSVDPDRPGQPVVAWEPSPVDTNIDQALAGPTPQRGRPAEGMREAIDFLCEALTDGPRLAKEVTEEAVEGCGIAKRTLDRARKQLGVVATRDTPKGPWSWSLPDGFGNLTSHIATMPESHNANPYTQSFWHSGNLEESTGKTTVSEQSEGPTLPDCQNSNVWGESDILDENQEGEPCERI